MTASSASRLVVVKTRVRGMKVGVINSKRFVTDGAEDVIKIVGVRQEKSPHRVIVSVFSTQFYYFC